MLGKSTLHGLDLAQEALVRFKKNGLPALVYVDPDVDGFFAAYFIIRVLNHEGIPYEWYINPNRDHGFLLDVDEIGGQFNVINGDFEIRAEILESLVSRGSTVLSLDHHDTPDVSEPIVFRNGDEIAVTINNQYPFEDPANRYESGAGVVLEVLRELYPGLLDDDSLTAMGGITLLSDVRDIHNPHAREQLSILYKHKYKGEIRRLHDGVMKGRRDWTLGVPRLERDFVDFTFTPSINSLIRLGREEEAFEFILGGEFPDGEPPQKTQREFINKVIQVAKVKHTPNLGFLRIDESDFLPSERLMLSNFLGLACSRLTDSGGVSNNILGFCVGLDGNITRASFRGTKTDIPYRSTLAKFLDARGHEIAFGIRNFEPTRENLLRAAREIAALEEGYVDQYDIRPVRNMHKFIQGEGKPIAEENAYRLSGGKIYLQYKGGLRTLDRQGEKFKVWLLDGVEVKQFDFALDIKTDLILPSLTKGMVDLILDRKAPEFEV